MPPLNDILLVTTAILVLMAPMTASFLKCWADRARVGEQGIPRGRSHCDGCGKTLGAIDLVPVLSWLWNRGRARCCDARLSPALLWPEAAALVCAIWGAWVASPPLAVVTVAMVWGLQAIILLHDVHTKIATWLIWLLVLSGLGLSVLGLSAPLTVHLTGFVAGLACIGATRLTAPLRPFGHASMLVAASGALLGLTLLAISTVIGTVMAVCYHRIAPLLGLPEPDWPHAFVVGFSSALWLTWLYGLAV